ncbi:oxygenase MpaB family protein [Nocardia sp. bgisy118]|uniref:oxygenase MpaB family protein n=1 Tax=Nocardia sp. bgisy118 TaxID=3413786 RepID=UPI003F4A4AFA
MTARAHRIDDTNADIAPELGPGSLTWRYAGDLRLLLVTAPYGMLQLMHPAVGAGVADHSDFFVDPWDRVFRSIPEIVGTVYDSPRSGTAARVRDYHRDIGGVDHHGKRYHALNPEVYFWTHATILQGVITIAEVYDGGLTDAQRETFYQEGKTWYRRYGLSERPMPADYAAFTRYFDDMCENVLEATESARWLAGQLGVTSGLRLPYLPGPIEAVVRPVIMSEYRVITTALLPESARDRLGLRYSAVDRARFRAAVTLIRNAWPLLPEPLRYHPRARQGMREHAALSQG